ncbi:thioesterase [Psychrobacter frigidicola]|uniref:Thioesterase n=1 Tax=Psychrobacter frigidicola TaxID=45611 RepID=A0A5C7A5C5_9GAMM|nr:thioesterase family protein [Psychrobacter frigidicola]TXD97895.1 thioesterase [Psychrobacter frigidicola]
MSIIISTTTSTKKAAIAKTATKPLFAVDYHVYINHTDAGGIVYHANHLVFFENCRRDWFTTLGLNTYFLQADNGQIQHFVVSQAELKYQKAIFLDEEISVRIDKVELKPASIIFYQSIHRHLPERLDSNDNLDNNVSNANNKPAGTLLSNAKIVIACVQNQTKPTTEADLRDSNTGNKAATVPSAAPIRPIRVPKQLHDSIQQAISQQTTGQ